MRRLTTLLALGAVALTAVSGCSLFGSDTVVLVAPDSFRYDQAVFDQFRSDTGITVEVRRSGDATALADKLVATKDDPDGDVVFGVDTVNATRVLAQDLFAEYRSAEADKGAQRFPADDTGRLTAVSVSDVCVNVDPAALAAKGLTPPATLADLTDAKYKDMLVVPDPSTSERGLAFLAATVSQFGPKGWASYWTQLKANGLRVVPSQDDAYAKEFSGSSGRGPRPMAVALAASPVAEADQDGRPKTIALPDTCFRSVDYAGVLKGSDATDDARKVVDFLLSDRFQKQIPDSAGAYPAREGVELPKRWLAAPMPQNAATVPASDIHASRDQWITQWRAAVQG